MPDMISLALGWALMCLRTAIGWSQTQLAKKAGLVDSSLLSRNEKGEKLTRERADWLASLLGFPHEALDVLIFAFRLIFPAKWKEPASPIALTPEELRPIDRATMAAGWAAAVAVRAELVRRKKKDKADAAMQEARELWERLKTVSPEERRKLVERSPEFRSWCLAVLACEASIRAAANNARQALGLARLAVFIAEQVPEADSVRCRLQGYCWAHVGNALRVGNNFEGADGAFARAWELWRAGDESDPELLPEWQVFDLEASLRRDQHRFAESLSLLDDAMAVSRQDPVATGRILLKKENVFSLTGDLRGALAVLAEAASFIEASGDRRQLFALRFNMADDLCHLERYEEGADILPLVRELAVEQGNELDLVRVVWLQAKVDAGQGREAEAVAGLEQVRREFTVRDLPYDAALSSLDLAVLWLKAGRTAELQKLALAMSWIFKAKGVDREALAALTLFCEAVKREHATVELARQVIAEVETVRRSAPLRNENRGEV
jgi:transcriptional regulator with XRE-family HTH domain